MQQPARESGQASELAQREREGGDRPIFASRTFGLGVFSLGLGLAEVFAPRTVARLIGLQPNRRACTVLRTLGAREMASGLGLLAQPKSALWAWSRVAGDLVDLALLGDSLFSPRAQHARIAGAAAAVLSVTAVDAVSATQLTRQTGTHWTGAIAVVQTVTINRSPTEVYDYWRDLENLPNFMTHLESVKVDNGTSKWLAKGPAGLSIEWEATVTHDEPSRVIAWRSVKGTAVPNRGEVRFRPAPGGRGTELTVDLRYEPPAGALGVAVAKLFGEEPNLQIASDLRRLKQVLETGEVVHSDASIHQGMHAARPSTAEIVSGKVGS